MAELFPAAFLNEQQLEALMRLVDFLADPDAVQYGLFGYAGTGKSTVLSFLSNSTAVVGKKVVLAAPTHKAVGVLAGMAREHNTGFYHFKTVAHLLNMKKKVNYDTGLSSFEPDLFKDDEGRYDWSASNLKRFDVIIVDECSMVKQRVYGWLMDAVRSLGKKIIFVGDPLQLPPVTEEKVNGGKSLSFNVPQRSLLKQVERFGGPIGQTVSQIRKNINPEQAYRPSFENCEDIARYGGTKQFFDEFMDVAQTGQIIAYRNKFVDKSNAVIRARLFGDNIPSFVPGERVVATSSSKIWHAQDEFVVQATEETTHKGIPCWRLRFEDQLWDTYVCDATQKPELNQKLRELKEKALHLSEQMQDSGADRRYLAKKRAAAWEDYHDFKDAFGRFRPAYAQTIHASQGSTYPEVFVLERDIHRLAYDPLYHGKMIYVAYSRASDLIRVV